MSTIWRPFTQMQEAPESLPCVKRAKKACIYLENGTEIIDAISSWWVITHGHCEPEIVKAVQKQSKILDQILFANFTHSPAEELVQELTSLLPSNLQKVFFSDNGSTSVEVALKISVQSWKQQGEPQRKSFITFSNSYHGDTVGAMSVSGRSLFTEPYEPLLFPIITAKQGRYSFDSEEIFYKDFEEKLEKHHKELSAVIIEPFIQGAGGMIIWPQKSLQKVCDLSKEAGLHLIFDEVMTGFGRTGSLFAFEQLNITPDILCLSKGLTGGMLPLAVTVAQDHIYKNFLSSQKKKAFLHGHSFTGNPISCAAATANLKLFKKNQKNIQKKWKEIESIHAERSAFIKRKKNYKDVRYKGLVAALEKSPSSYSSPLAEFYTEQALKKGVFLRPLGETLYILPPYSITKEELHKTWDTMEFLIDLK